MPKKNLISFLNRKKSVSAKSQIEVLKKYELEKYTFVRSAFISMLQEFDAYSEKDWQKLVVELLLLIFPKYVAVLDNVHIKDFYSKQRKSTNRYIDLALVDASGNIDIIEIKKPFPNCVLSRKYRDNYFPHKELSGSVMQVEKYIFHLSKWGIVGENQLNAKRSNELPNNLKIRITNPKAFIILGRDNDFVGDQRFDFEIIKRKYANIIDIMTFDDLLRRLDNMISMLSRTRSTSATPPNAA